MAYHWLSIPTVREKMTSLVVGQTDEWFWDLKQYVKGLANPAPNPKETTSSACHLIPAERLCVLPKALTPEVGCTIRSLTHNLSLHVGASQVRQRWFNHQFHSDFNSNHLNVLVVPYPYVIKGSDFCPHTTNPGSINTFSVTQSWLDETPEIELIIKSLMTAAECEGRPVNVVILPELALSPDKFDAIVTMIKSLTNRFVLLVAGVASKDGQGNEVNASFTAYIEGGNLHSDSFQKKHHRWKVDKDQIATYSLGASLEQGRVWWEQTQVNNRVIDYHVFRKDACFATLICEDLARQDPCKPSIQSVGPNLIFALLMDSPQFKNRWPGQYALSLTDDPGSSVLTLTSLGLVKRSNWTHNGHRRTVALWGDQKGIREIDLPENHQGILLYLTSKEEKQYTLDDRSIDNQFWQLDEILPLAVPM